MSIDARELRIGNLIEANGPAMEVKAITENTVELYLHGSESDNWEEDLEKCNGILLTEDNILKLRVVERDEFKPLLFSQQPPGERQVEMQYWSSWIHEDYRLHLCPNYKTIFPTPNTSEKSKEIDFWFIWYCEATRFLPLMNIRQYQLQYVHQLQNLYHSLTGKELTINYTP